MQRKSTKSKIDLFIIARVKSLRDERHFTQLDLAVHLEVSLGYIGQIESSGSRAKYNVRHLNELAGLLKCSPKDFLPEKPL